MTLDKKSGDADKLREQVMDLSRDIYRKNFENGLDVQPFKWGEVVLLTILGMFAGGLAGFGVDRYLDMRKNREVSQQRTPSDPLLKDATNVINGHFSEKAKRTVSSTHKKKDKQQLRFREPRP